jgi:hypothetical protein
VRHHRWTEAELVKAFELLPAGPFLNEVFFNISFRITGERWHSDSLRRALANSGLVVRAGRKNKKLILWEKVERVATPWPTEEDSTEPDVEYVPD